MHDRREFRHHYKTALVALWAGNPRAYRRLVSAIVSGNMRRADALCRIIEDADSYCYATGT